MNVNTQGASQTLIESLQARIAEYVEEIKLCTAGLIKALGKNESLEARNAELETKNSILESQSTHKDTELFLHESALKELQAVVDRLASSEKMRPPLSGCCNEVEYRIEYAAKHKTQGTGNGD